MNTSAAMPIALALFASLAVQSPALADANKTFQKCKNQKITTPKSWKKKKDCFKNLASSLLKETKQLEKAKSDLQKETASLQSVVDEQKKALESVADIPVPQGLCDKLQSLLDTPAPTAGGGSYTTVGWETCVQPLAWSKNHGVPCGGAVGYRDRRSKSQNIFLDLTLGAIAKGNKCPNLKVNSLEPSSRFNPAAKKRFGSNKVVAFPYSKARVEALK